MYNNTFIIVTFSIFAICMLALFLGIAIASDYKYHQMDNLYYPTPLPTSFPKEAVPVQK